MWILATYNTLDLSQATLSHYFPHILLHILSLSHALIPSLSSHMGLTQVSWVEPYSQPPSESCTVSLPPLGQPSSSVSDTVRNPAVLHSPARLFGQTPFSLKESYCFNGTSAFILQRRYFVDPLRKCFMPWLHIDVREKSQLQSSNPWGSRDLALYCR